MTLSAEGIQTKRLHLRKLDHNDRPAVLEIFCDPEVTRYFDVDRMTTLSDAERFISETGRGFRDGSLLQWGIIATETGRLIGTCAYAAWDRKSHRAEIGFALHRACWGKGYMKELLPAFITFGFDELGLDRIDAETDPQNLASISLLKKMGFQSGHVLKGKSHPDQASREALYFTLSRELFDR